MGMAGRPIPDLGWTGPPGPWVGYIYSSSLFRQAFMAELARALPVVYMVLGSILADCKFYFFFIAVCKRIGKSAFLGPNKKIENPLP